MKIDIYDVERCSLIGYPIIYVVNLWGMALILELIKMIVRESIWTKNLIILFNDQNILGVQAWLNAYQDIKHPLIGEEDLISKLGENQYHGF